MATSTKRRNEDDDDHMARKKLQMEQSCAAKRRQTKYRAPKGVRKSDRIAGRPADPLDSRPRGQHNRDEQNPGVKAVPVPHQRGSAEGTPSESLEGEYIPRIKAADAPRSRP